MNKPARSRLNSTSTPQSLFDNAKNLSLVSWTFLFWGGAIAILIIFVTLILPIIIKFSAEIKMNNSDKPVVAQIVQAPIVNMPPEATNSAKLAISGYAPAQTKLYLLQNGIETLSGELTIPDNGEFDLDLNLDQGKNTFQFYVINEQGDKSNKSLQFSVLLDQEDPTITLTEELPTEIIGRDNQTLTIKGKTEKNISVYVNDRLTTSNSDGDFSSNLYLNEGENTITIRVVDKALNENELVTKVNFRL